MCSCACCTTYCFVLTLSGRERWGDDGLSSTDEEKTRGLHMWRRESPADQHSNKATSRSTG